MAVPIVIKDGQGNGKSVKVSQIGELITRAFEYSTPIFNTLNVDNQVFNFFKPQPGKKFVITDVIADANRDIGATGVTVDIYEALNESSTIIETQILKFDMIKQTSKVLNGLNFITTGEGIFINAKADDSSVLLTISGFFIPV